MGSESLVDLSHSDDFEKKPKVTNLYVYFYTFVADLILLTYGCSVAWPSSVIPQLQSNNTEINTLGYKITTVQVSLISSIPSAAMAINYFFTGKLTDWIGRKNVMTVMGCSFCLAYLIITFTTNIYLYYICLFTIGIGSGGSIISVSIYINEIAHENNRGKLGCTLGLSISIGISLGYFIGSLTSANIFSLTCALPPFLHLIFSRFITESPYYLASKGHKYEALTALKKIRGNQNVNAINSEFKIIEDILDNDAIKRSNFMDLFRNRAARKALLISLELYIFQQFSGSLVILSFAAPIFNEAGCDLSGYTVANMVGLAVICTYTVAASLVDRFGRRILLLISSLVCVVSLLILGLYFYLKHTDVPFSKNISWLPVVTIIIYIFGYGIGLGPIPLGLSGELIPCEFRTIGYSVLCTIESWLMFLILFCFPLASKSFGNHVCMWAFSAASFFGFICMFFSLPETKRSNLLEIQEILRK